MQPSLIRQSNRDLRSLFLIVLAVLVLSWVEGVTFGQTELKPGPHDPMGKPSRYTIFRDDELLTYVPGGSQADFFTYDVNGSLSPTQIGDVTTGYSSASNQLAAAAGRIVS